MFSQRAQVDQQSRFLKFVWEFSGSPYVAHMFYQCDGLMSWAWASKTILEIDSEVCQRLPMNLVCGPGGLFRMIQNAVEIISDSCIWSRALSQKLDYPPRTTTLLPLFYLLLWSEANDWCECFIEKKKLKLSMYTLKNLKIVQRWEGENLWPIRSLNGVAC